MPPEKAGRKWRFMVRDANGRHWKSFNDYDECLSAWTDYIGQSSNKPMVAVEVQAIEQYNDIDSLWEFVEANQVNRRTDTPRILMPNEPFAIAFISDLHIGSAGCDYKKARADAEIVRDTPGMYAIFHGDGIDNWILPKMAGLQRGQMVPFDQEIALFGAWMKTIGEKLICVVAGNHDNWTSRMSGIDVVANVTPPTTLYDQNQILFDLKWSVNSLRICVRHKWRGSSQANPTGGMEKSARDLDADVYVGGHTHIGTLFRSFVVRGKDRLAVLTGTYKTHDEYAAELGFPESSHSGCGAMVVDPDGSITWIRDLKEAARYLAFKRSEVMANAKS